MGSEARDIKVWGQGAHRVLPLPAPHSILPEHI